MTKSKDKKKLINNFLSLFIVQGSNYIIPLVTFPYIVHTIGLEKFGLISFAVAFIAYPTLLVLYGMDLSGAREIASSKHSKRKLRIILSSIMSARLILLIISLIITLLVVFSFERFSKDWILYIVTFGSILGTISFPIWFFQGMEKMKFITYLSLGAKILYMIGIFVFVHTENDYIYIPLLNFISLMLVGIVSFVIIKKEFGISLMLPRWKYIVLQFIKGWHLFVSNLAINLFTSFNMLILGLLSSDLIVGYYALAEKIVKIIASLFKPLNQALFPHVVQLVKKSNNEGRLFVNKIFFYMFMVSTFIWSVFFIFSENIFSLVFGENAIHSIPVFNILSVLIIIMPLAAWVYNVILISFKMEKYFLKIFSFVAILNVIVVAVSLFWFESKENVIASALVFSELVSLLLGLYLYKTKVEMIKERI